MLSALLFIPCLLTRRNTVQGAQEVLTPTSYFSLLLKARADYGKSDYQTAANEFAILAQHAPESGEAWLALGNSYYGLHEPAKAIEPYQKAFALGHGTSDNNAYNIACCYALSGQKEDAFRWLNKALALRFETRSLIQTDPDPASLHGDPRFPHIAGLPPNKDFSRAKRWRYDIDFLTGEMARMHYRWSVEGVPSGIKKDAKTLASQVDKLSDAEIAVRLQRLMAQLGDGHSMIGLASSNAGLQVLPIQLYKFEEGTYIVNSSPDSALVGARVLEIGGKPIGDLWSSVAPYVSRDNDMGITWFGPQYLAITQVLKDLGAAASGPTMSLKVVMRDGSQKTVDLSPSDLKVGHVHPARLGPAGGLTEAPLYLRHENDQYWFQPLPEAAALYVQFNQVQDKPDETLPAFGIRLRKDLKENPVQNLIVDIRHNSGGNSELESELIRTLISFSASGGRIFLITGRNTFSAAQNFENDIVRMANPIVVGEPSSSKPFFVGESSPFVLPYSQMKGTISTRLHTVNARDERVWIAPDVPVPVRAADYFGGKDAALDAILAIVKAMPQAKTS